MTKRLLAGCVLLSVMSACGPSEEELALRRQVRDLRGELADQKQRADDLRVRVQTIRARNRVLISLVLGLTSESPDAPRGTALSEPLGKAHQALAALDRDLDVLASSLKKSRSDFVELRSERNRLEDKLEAAMATIEEAKKREQQAQARLSTFRDMLLSLRAMIEEAKLEVQVVDNRMLVQLPEAVLFESGKAAITSQGEDLLDRLASVLRAIDDREFQVAGHTDSVPIRNWRYPSNWHLSATRAVNVTRYLIERGVPAARISAAGYADTRPAPGASPTDGPENRRIEVVVLPKREELPDLSVLDEARPAAQGEGEPEPESESKAEPEPEPEPESQAGTDKEAR